MNKFKKAHNVVYCLKIGKTLYYSNLKFKLFPSNKFQKTHARPKIKKLPE